MPESGNPNVYTSYRSKFSISAPDNGQHVCMLSNCNDVIFCDDYVSTSNGVICSLAQELWPDNPICMCVPNGNNVIDIVWVYPNGSVEGNTGGVDYYMNGKSFNISGNYYG